MLSFALAESFAPANCNLIYPICNFCDTTSETIYQ